jgi:hypothetical protein
VRLGELEHPLLAELSTDAALLEAPNGARSSTAVALWLLKNVTPVRSRQWKPSRATERSCRRRSSRPPRFRRSAERRLRAACDGWTSQAAVMQWGASRAARGRHKAEQDRPTREREPRRALVLTFTHARDAEETPRFAAPSSDGETQTRTGDTTIFSRVLYQLSYLAGPPMVAALCGARPTLGGGRRVLGPAGTGVRERCKPRLDVAATRLEPGRKNDLAAELANG